MVQPVRVQLVALTFARVNYSYVRPFLGVFAKLRKATISFVMSVLLSVRMKQLGFHRKDFHEIDI
jgi:hypothetical protein